MSQLDTETYNAIVELLSVDYLTGTDDKRFALFEGAFHSIKQLQHIDVRAGTKLEAVSRMVSELDKFGTLDGTPALWILLEHVKQQVGDDIRAKIDALESKFVVRRIGASRAVLYADSDDVQDLARAGLVGRDELKAEVLRELQGENARVLLQGFGGIGKTALAAHIAVDWLDAKRSQVLWLRLGNDETNVVFEALAHPFGASQAVASSTDEGKPQVIRQMLRDSEVKLVVLDDVWNGTTLAVIEKAIPRSVALLVTARQRYPLRKIKSVPDLSPDDALELLREIAGDDLTGDEKASRELCKTLGYLAFAIELAGHTMKATTHPTQRFLADMKTADVTQLKVPLDYAETGRESIAALIQTTLNALPETAKNAFLAWGAFWSTNVTPEMLRLYFEQIKDTDLQGNAENALDQLQLYGLATYEKATVDSENYPLAVAYYKLHELAYAFAAAQSSDEQCHHALDACLAYTKHHKKPSRENFAALEPELDNCLGAATFAMQQECYSDVEQFAWRLYRGSEVLYIRGYYAQAVDLLQQAVIAAKNAEKKGDQGVHLGNLGNVYFRLGQYEKAIHCHQQALAIKHEVGNKHGIGEGFNNLGLIYNHLEQYDNAIEHYQQALAISREFENRLAIGSILCNLGSTYLRLNQYDNAIEHYQQALAISRDIGDRGGEGNNLGNLGIVYRNLGQYDNAIEHYQQALAISRDIGDRLGESNRLNNLGVAYENLKDYGKSIICFEQALAIRLELKVPNLIKDTERSLQWVRAKLAGDSEE